MPLDLPRAGRDRLARVRAQPALAWAAHPGTLANLDRVGFDVVGEVMGCVASVLSHEEAGLCGFRGSGTPPIRLGARLWGMRRTSYPTRAEAAYRTAVERVREEARARGADGVVSISRWSHHLEGDLVETVLTGEAVRARTTRRPAKPFLTSCSATRVAELLVAGWVPVDLHVAVELGVRHEETLAEHADQLRQARATRRSRFEIPGFTELINRVRASVRDKLRTQVRAAGADGASVVDLDVHSHHGECHSMVAGTDRVVRAIGWADSFARFAHRPAADARALTVMPVGSSSGGAIRL